MSSAGFRVTGRGKHIVLTDGTRILTPPRRGPVSAFRIGCSARDAWLAIQELHVLL